MSKKIDIKCCNCPYYTGIQCHGHGDFWGTCTILHDKRKVMKILFEKHDGDNASYLCDKGGAFSDVRYDDSTCKFFELEDYNK